MRIGIGHADPGPDGGGIDSAARALANALLGAAGLDRGNASPGRGGETDSPGERPALDLLSRAVRAVEGENYQVVNVDLAVMGREPAVRGDPAAPRGGDGIRRELADRLHVSPGHVSLEPAAGVAPDVADRDGGVLAVALLDRIAPMDQVHSPLRAGG